MTKSDRMARQCDGCKALDTHAHHVQYVAFNHPITQEATDISVSKHIQCCAADGCEICSTHVEFAPTAEIGDDFTAYQQDPTSDHLTALAERHGISNSEGA